jgi:tellurite resistance protein TerC
MNNSLLIYLVFSGLVVLALVFDLGLISKKNTIITLKNAIVQTIFWVSLAFAFSVFVWYENGPNDALQYLSAYLLEWSLSVDNIFVFIIIFSFFGVQKQDYSRVLLLGILMAIVFRILFIALGSGLVARFDWIMYIFGVFLVYTGSKMFSSSDEEEFKPEDSFAFKMMKKFMPTTNAEPNGRFIIKKENKIFMTF